MDILELYDGKSRSAFYRTKAKECRQSANATVLKDVRQTYLNLADQWDNLARQIDARLA